MTEGNQITVASPPVRSSAAPETGPDHITASHSAPSGGRHRDGDGRVAVPLGGKRAAGRAAYVTSGRYDLVIQHRWWVWEQRRANGTVSGPYAATKVRRADGGQTTLFMHDLIMGCKGVDHRDGDGLNNTDDNLRRATDAQNKHNRGKRNGDATSRFKGVHRDRGRWRATIKSDGHRYSLGGFADEETAARAYDAAAIRLHGEFARLNFPAVAA